MDKCFWKKVLAVVFGVSIVSFLATAVSTINYKLTSNDYVEFSLENMGAEKLINKNIAILVILLLCVVGVIVVSQMMKNQKMKIGISSVILVISIVTSIVGIVLLWNYREDMTYFPFQGADKSSFYARYYAVWQEYISNMMTLSFYAVISIASLFTNTLITEKKDA